LFVTRNNFNTISSKETSSLTKQKQEKISEMFGVNDITHIFAPAFKKSTETIDSDKEIPKKSRIPFDKKFQRCIFAILQKNQFLKTR